jgi:hypothetical protein
MKIFRMDCMADIANNLVGQMYRVPYMGRAPL